MKIRGEVMIFKQISASYECPTCNGSPLSRTALGGGFTMASLKEYIGVKCPKCKGELDLIRLKAKVVGHA